MDHTVIFSSSIQGNHIVDVAQCSTCNFD